MSRDALLTVVLAGLLGLSCASWRAAQLYQGGTAALDAGEVQRAVADLEQASRLAPDASEIRNHLGLAYLAAGDKRAARDAFERAVALDCENGAAHRNLQVIEADWAGGP